MLIRLSSIMLFVVLSLIPCASYADVTYTYTGNPFDIFSADSQFSSSDRITGSITFAAPISYSSIGSNLLNQALSFSFSDSFNPPITKTTKLCDDVVIWDEPPLPNFVRANSIIMAPDIHGNIYQWYIQFFPLSYYYGTRPFPPEELTTTNSGYWDEAGNEIAPADYDYAASEYYPASTSLGGGILYSAAVESAGTWTTTINAPGPEPAPVPEPASILLFGTGLAGLAGLAGLRRKKKKT